MRKLLFFFLSLFLSFFAGGGGGGGRGVIYYNSVLRSLMTPINAIVIYYSRSFCCLSSACGVRSIFDSNKLQSVYLRGKFAPF